MYSDFRQRQIPTVFSARKKSEDGYSFYCNICNRELQTRLTFEVAVRKNLILKMTWNSFPLFVVFVFKVVSSRAELEDNRLYAIQNELDKTYVKAINNGEICDRRGDVITSRNLDQHSTAYRWMYKSLINGRVHLDIDSHDFKINEITMQETPPNCYSAYVEYELAPVNEQTYRIRNFHSKKCLTGHGPGQKVTWEGCVSVWRNFRSQFWNFIDLDKEKLYKHIQE